MKDVSIGTAARATGVKVPTIRYYEEVGLLPRAPRTGSNRRLYGADDLNRLRFIRHARELGFDIDAIRALLDLQAKPETSCAGVDAIAREHLAEVDRRIESLQALKRELERMLTSCQRGRIAECRIIEVLQDHAQCRHHDKPLKVGRAMQRALSKGA
jgi:DNA-binding transcriptional MerR regulator